MAAGTVARNFVWVTLSRVLDAVGNLVVVAVVARYLGVEDFGEFSFYMAIAWTLSPFLTLGIPKILVREIAKDRQRAPELTGAAWALVLLTSAALLALAGGVWLLVSARAGAALAVLVGALTALTMMRIVNSVYWGFERMEYELAINVAVSVVYLGLAVGAVSLDLGVMAVYASFLAANLLGLSLSTAVSVRSFGVAPRLTLRADALRYLARESGAMLVAQGLFQAYLYSGVFVLKSVGSAYALGIFQAPTRVVTRLQIIPLSAIAALAPLLSRLAAADPRRLREVERSIAKVLFTASVPLALAGVVFAPEIVRLLFGPAFGEAAIVLQVQVCALALFFLNTNIEALLVALGRQHLLSVIYGCGLAASVAANLLLVPTRGHVGASAAVVASQALIFAVGLAVCSDVFPLRDAWGALWRPLAAAAAGGAVAAVLPWRGSTLLFCAGLAAFGAALVAVRAFSREERDALRGLLPRRLPGTAG